MANTQTRAHAHTHKHTRAREHTHRHTQTHTHTRHENATTPAKDSGRARERATAAPQHRRAHENATQQARTRKHHSTHKHATSHTNYSIIRCSMAHKGESFLKLLTLLLPKTSRKSKRSIGIFFLVAQAISNSCVGCWQHQNY